MGVDYRNFIGLYTDPNYLQHHGVLGMKWGVRRYQNKDGTYTRQGMVRYRKAQEEYDAAKNKMLTSKTSGIRADIKNSKMELKTAKRRLNSSYDQLKDDYKADQGEKLYRKGKTIPGNISKRRLSRIGLVAGSYAVNEALTKCGDIKLSLVSTPTIALGAAAISVIIGKKTKSDNEKLRAYYARVGQIRD